MKNYTQDGVVYVRKDESATGLCCQGCSFYKPFQVPMCKVDRGQERAQSCDCVMDGTIYVEHDHE